MTRTRLLVVVLVASASVGLCLAAELELEVAIVSPSGPYSVQVVPIVIDLPVDQISQVSLRLRGTYSDQTFLCGSTPGMQTESAASGVLVSLGDDVSNTSSIQVPYTFPANPGAPLDYDITLVLLSRSGDDWAFLADGTAQLGFSDNPKTVYDSNRVRCYPGEVFGTVTSAILVVAYDPGVATQALRWASVKALYR